jgi:MinD-like ATPase involved in chromosome partitioning or flagellar assembly
VQPARPAAPPALPAVYDDRAEVNSLASSAGLSQALRQERHTTVVKPRPQSGWRHAVLVSSFGVINPGESRVEREDRERRARVCANVSPPFVFAAVGGMGGVGKTVTAAALGSMFAACRGGGEVVVIDADPIDPNLASRVSPEAAHTFADVLSDRDVASRSAIRRYAATSETSQLDVLAGSDDLVNPQVYDPDTFAATIQTLSRVYSVIGVDVGADFRSPVVARVLDMVTAVVVCTGVQFDAGKASLRLHDWMVATGRSELVARSFLVMSERTPDTQKELRADIETTVSSTAWKDPVYVPYDPHLYEASVLDLDQLKPRTRRSYLEGAARLSDWYGASPVPLHTTGRWGW